MEAVAIIVTTCICLTICLFVAFQLATMVLLAPIWIPVSWLYHSINK